MDRQEIKKKIIKEFKTMKTLEEKASDFYKSVFLNPKIEISANKIFKEIADEEERHSSLVQKIINIVNNTL